MSETPTIVIDHGSLTCRAGFPGDVEPRAVIPTIVGHCRSPDNGKERHVGEEAKRKHAEVTESRDYVLKYPIEGGIVTNWDDMEFIWHHIFYTELKIDPEQHHVLLTEPPLNPACNRERMTQIMFETFNPPMLHIVAYPVLSLFSSGCTTGVLVSSGSSITWIVPVYEGCMLLHAIMGKNIPAGRDVDDFLMTILDECNYSEGSFTGDYSHARQREIAVDIKERECYIALDYDTEMKVASESSDKRIAYEIPDGSGKIITLNDQRFRGPEVLFQNTSELTGIHTATFHSIMKSDPEVHKDFYGNVVLSDGNSMLRGFSERMTKELTALAPSAMRVKVSAIPRLYSAFEGGSILASPGSRDMWMSSSEYAETGPELVHKKCPV